jgi:hypothetical protein
MQEIVTRGVYRNCSGWDGIKIRHRYKIAINYYNSLKKYFHLPCLYFDETLCYYGMCTNEKIIMNMSLNRDSLTILAILLHEVGHYFQFSSIKVNMKLYNTDKKYHDDIEGDANYRALSLFNNYFDHLFTKEEFLSKLRSLAPYG